MSDLSALSDDELKALYQKGSGISVRPVSDAGPDLSGMSDADLMKAYAAPSGMLEDAVKSIGSGLASATAHTLGGVGDIRSGLSSVADYLGGKAGIAPDKVQTFKDYMSKAAPLLASAPTTRDIINSAPDPIISPDYQPQYGINRVLKKGAEFAPNMLAGGPEGALARFATNVAVPAIGSEIGENVAGPYGGVAGALIGAGGASAAAQKFKALAAARIAAKAMPTGEQLLETGGNQFDQARDMNVTVKPEFATDAAAKMRDALKGFDPEAQGVVFKAADRLENLGKPPSSEISPAQRLQAEMNWEAIPAKSPAEPVDMNDVELIRKQLTAMKASTDGSVREAARRAISSLQESQLALTPAQTLRGDAPAFVKTTRDAIGNYAAGKNSQTIQGKMNLAELHANSPVGMLDAASGGQALQRTMKQLARPVNNTNVPVARKLGFNNQEVAAINQAASGTKMTHAAEMLDRLIPAKLGAIPAAIARQIGGLTTKRQVAALDSLVRSRSPSAAHVAAQLPPQIVNQLPAKTQRILQTLALSAPQVQDQIVQPGTQYVGQTPAY